LDESFRVYLARMTPHDFLIGLLHPFGANSAAYHLLLRYWLLLGSSETVLRGLSVIFGVATVAAVWKLGSELFDQETGFMAAALAACNALLIRYSQEICAYTLGTLLAVLSSLYLCRAIQRNRRAEWAGYVVTAVFMLYCHVLTILVVAAQASAFLLSRHRWSSRGLLSFSVVATAFAPLGWCIAFAPPRPAIWLAKPGFRDVLGFLGDMGGPRGLLLGVIFLALALVGIAYGVRNRISEPAWRYLFVGLWALLPPALLFLLSQWQPLFIPRYLLGSIPALLLLAAATVRRLEQKFLRIVCVAIVLLLSLRGTALYLRHRSDFQKSDDWRHATAYLVQQVRPSDTIVFLYPYERFPFQYYRDKFAPQGIPGRIFPAGSDEAVLENPYPSESDAYAAAAASQRVWLITEYTPNPKFQSLQEALERRFHNSGEQHFGYIRLILFSNATNEGR
jgi:mannosyltransferase